MRATAQNFDFGWQALPDRERHGGARQGRIRSLPPQRTPKQQHQIPRGLAASAPALA